MIRLSIAVTAFMCKNLVEVMSLVVTLTRRVRCEQGKSSLARQASRTLYSFRLVLNIAMITVVVVI